MKKLLPGTLALLILLCSCNAKKSFLSQRYTNFKHKRPITVTENRSYADKGSKTAVTAPEIAVINSGPVQAKPLEYTKLVYTQSVLDRVVLPVALKGKEQIASLVSNNSKLPVTKLTKIKPLNLKQKHEKRGLLWGVIDGILAIILIAAFVALIIWLIVLLAV
jgi:hypothetical protein